jgi:hypothetical protein
MGEYLKPGIGFPAATHNSRAPTTHPPPTHTGRLEEAYTRMKGLCDQGYSAMDVITTLFRVRTPAVTYFLLCGNFQLDPTANPHPSLLSFHRPPLSCKPIQPRPAAQVCRNAPTGQSFNEFMQLEFLREIGFCHVRIGDGVNSRLQLSGLLAKLCRVATGSGAGGGGQQQQQQQQVQAR